MWYIVLGIFLLISALAAIFFWFTLIAAKRGDEKSVLDFSDNEDY